MNCGTNGPVNQVGVPRRSRSSMKIRRRRVWLKTGSSHTTQTATPSYSDKFSLLIELRRMRTSSLLVAFRNPSAISCSDTG